MITRQELTTAVSGVRGLLRFDAKALGLFDATLDGFWKSFWAAAILAPFTAIMILRQTTLAPPGSPWRYIAFQVIGYVIGWLAFPLAMVRISQYLGRRERYFAFMVAYNWFHLAEIVLWAPVLMLGIFGVLPPAIEGLLSLAVLAALLGYDWFIVRNALKVEAGTAAALVAIDLLLGLLIDRISDALP